MLVIAMTFSPAASGGAQPTTADTAPPPGTYQARFLLADEPADQKLIVDAVKASIGRKDYQALNAMETEFRETRARTVSGIWKLSVFHWRVRTELGPQDDDPACDDRSSDFFRGWIAATPDEPAPYISRAAVLEAYAWCIRGTDYAQNVSEQAFEGFRAKVEEARQILTEHRSVASVDPHYYAVMARIYIDQTAEKTDFGKLLDEATSREPNYHYLYFDAYRYFQPQWYGSDAEVEELARYAAARTKAAEGLGTYARFYWFALDCDCGTIKQSIDWPTMKQAMRDVMAHFPSDWNAANFARISCHMDDPQEAKRWLGRVKGDHSFAFSKGDEYHRCLRMAGPTERSWDRCPFAASEGWSRADLDKYCREPPLAAR